MGKDIARVKYNDKYWLRFSTNFMDGYKSCSNDIQIILEDDKGSKLDDAICHYGSYGVEQGEWEIMSQSLPKNHGDSVMGHLTWKQVEKYFDKTIKKIEKLTPNHP